MKMELKQFDDKIYVEFTRQKDSAKRSVPVDENELKEFMKQCFEFFNIMTFEKYQQLRRNTDKYAPEQAPFCHALGLTSESGEVSGKYDKHYRKFQKFEPNEEQRKAIALELGDVMWFVGGCADDIGYTLADIAQFNIDKLADRDNRNQISSIEGGDYR